MPVLLVLVAVLLMLAATSVEAGGGARVRVDPNFPPLSLGNPGWSGTGLDQAPRARTRTVPRQQRPVIACDAYGRCWQQGAGYGYDYGYRAPLTTRPPGWADDLPLRAQEADRFFRPRSGVVCDRGTSICYKSNRVDKSETETWFGSRAGDRADDLRDRRGTARLFVPESGVTCDRTRQVCYDGGEPDSSLTRRYFGQKAARAID